MWTIQGKALNKDEVTLDSFVLEDFLISNESKLSPATFKRGLNELEKSQILAKTVRKGIYFINPNFIFNGNRIAFTNAIERKRKSIYNKARKHGQLDIFDNNEN